MKKIISIRDKAVGVYNPFLDTLGGGEKYLLSILKVIEDLGFTVEIFWDKDLSSQIKTRFNLGFKNLKFKENFFKKSSFIKKFQILNRYELFIYVTDGSYFFSAAKKNFVYAMIPEKKLYELNFINKIKLSNYRFITHSKFNQNLLKEWGISSDLLYPYIDDSFFLKKELTKKNIILSVGRFFKHLHNKNHLEMIDCFRRLKSKNNLFKDFTLVLAGGLKKEDEDYYQYLKKIANKEKQILLTPNLSYNELLDLYRQARFFWHFAGLNINEKKYPEKVEHLGIAPLEAMAAGCLVFCYKAGGPKEIVEDGKNGFLFKNKNELNLKMNIALSKIKLEERIRHQAIKYIKKNFSYSCIKKQVIKIFSLESITNSN